MEILSYTRILFIKYYYFYLFHLDTSIGTFMDKHGNNYLKIRHMENYNQNKRYSGNSCIYFLRINQNLLQVTS